LFKSFSEFETSQSELSAVSTGRLFISHPASPA
jgi:hypothetical protein